MKSTGTKAKQVAAVMSRKGLSRKAATRIVTRHRLAGEAVGGYTVTSKRAKVQSGNGGPSTPAKTPKPKPVKPARSEYNRPGSLAGSNRSGGPKPHNDSPVNLPDQPKSYQRPRKGGGGRMKVT